MPIEDSDEEAEKQIGQFELCGDDSCECCMQPALLNIPPKDMMFLLSRGGCTPEGTHRLRSFKVESLGDVAFIAESEDAASEMGILTEWRVARQRPHTADINIVRAILGRERSDAVSPPRSSSEAAAASPWHSRAAAEPLPRKMGPQIDENDRRMAAEALVDVVKMHIPKYTADLHDRIVRRLTRFETRSLRAHAGAWVKFEKFTKDKHGVFDILSPSMDIMIEEWTDSLAGATQPAAAWTKLDFVRKYCGLSFAMPLRPARRAVDGIINEAQGGLAAALCTGHVHMA